ncbi:MAG TPA: SDR family oxidoreductase [Thermoanaerobaculia bacterium]|nr:SDR family oxidoreductase [Thermoanaerobaculia bacterium]
MAGRRILITGGASGLGRALAERYARDGWRVAIADVHERRGAETLAALGSIGADALFVRCDVTREADLEAAARSLEEKWGGVDVVVNNAGVALAGGIAETSLSDWEWIIDVNLLGVVRGCRVFTPLFRRQGSGRFVNVSSMAGLVHPPMVAAYAATKAGVVALSESLRLELAPDGIRVSAVCPAFFRSNLVESLRASDPALADQTRDLLGRVRTTAAETAERIHRGVSRGDFLILTHADGRLAWRLKRLLPVSLYLRLLGWTSARLYPSGFRGRL